MNGNTLLYRQIHPSFVRFDQQTQDLRATSQAFYPSETDRRISVYDGDRISARDSWVHYTEVENRQSCGVMAVTTDECQRLRLPVEADGLGFPEHVSIDCSALTTRRQIETNAKRLRAAANARGWQFQPGTQVRHDCPN